MQKKKVVAMVLAAACAVTAMTGCGSTKGGASG